VWRATPDRWRCEITGTTPLPPWSRALRSRAALVAAFAAVEPDGVMAATGALACFGLAAEWAARQARGPGSFKVALLDALHRLRPEDLQRGARIEVVAGEI